MDVRSSSVLVIGPAWVGDMVMAQSLFKTLRHHDSKVAIDVVAPPWSNDLLARMPEVRFGYGIAVAHGEAGLRKRWKLGKKLRANHYSRAIVLPRSAKAAIVPWVAGIPTRTGYLGEYRYGLLNDIRTLDSNRHYRTVDRFVALAPTTSKTTTNATHPAPPHLISTAGQQAVTEHELGLGDTDQQPVLALCPGAEYGPAKRWPTDYFVSLANEYKNKGWSVRLIGSMQDRAITSQITNSVPTVTDLAGKTTIQQAIDLLASAQVVVSNDSGLMHIAAATGTPVVALYGSSDPQYTPPLTSQAEILYEHLPCSPCFQRQCPLGHLNCLTQITPQAVSSAIARLSNQ